jgi:hypothetical protein
MSCQNKSLAARLGIVLLLLNFDHVRGAEPMSPSRADQMLAAYFRAETRKIAEACLADVRSWDDWTSRRDLLRRQLREMLGLEPLPERTPLEAVVTGTVDHADFTVDKLHFQSRPQLYVTANLYVPKNLQRPAPAILYVCGHSPSKKDGVSYGNKTKYQHHGAWFARNGYVCLVIDTLQLGEIEGIHHGTYRENMWWWNAMGYTSAGVEAWNAMRALDYLETRPEVDANRLGVTGRSGGGAYSWWLAALDDRIKAAVPVAGITSLENHIVDGCVEGHCDCMYLVHTYPWDYAQVAALVAPRPLLLANTDHDTIFPLDGVMDVYWKVRNLYDLAGKPDNLGLQIAAGPHEDTQVLQLHAFQWFNQHLQGDDGPLDARAPSYFEPEQLRVFEKLPSDEINTRVHEVFTQAASPPEIPASQAEWQSQRAHWLAQLREKSFGGWPKGAKYERSPEVRKLFDAQSGDVNLSAYEFDSQEHVTLRLYLLSPLDVPSSQLETVVLHPLDADGWSGFVAAMRSDFEEQFAQESPMSAPAQKHSPSPQSLVMNNRAVAYFAPRGIGPTAWSDGDLEEHTHIRRRFMLLGQTLDGMRVWDTRRAIQALRSVDGFADKSLHLIANREMAGIALYTALFEPGIVELALPGLAQSHREGPDFLNVLRVLDVPQVVAMVAENSTVQIVQDGDRSAWKYPLDVAEKLGWEDRIRIHPSTAAAE